jgi:D-hydroxyproline dehydrogenase subunit gamma
MRAGVDPPGGDPIRPGEPATVTISVDGAPCTGLLGQSIAGVLLASGSLAWRVTSAGSRPRGVFCGIGVCFDCLVEVNDEADVRACLRRAVPGDVVVSQHHVLPTLIEEVADEG